MKYFVFSKNGALTPVAKRLADEGNKVALYIDNARQRSLCYGVFAGLNEPLPGDYEVVITDSVGDGRVLDDSRRAGRVVLGGSLFADNILLTPGYADSLLKLSGVTNVPHEYDIEGWFNGEDWVVGLTSVSISERRFLTGDLGVEVDCAGTTFCYWKKYRPEVFKETLYRLSRLLKNAGYRGPVSFVGGRLHTGFSFDSLYSAIRLSSIDAGKLLHDVGAGKLVKVKPSFDYSLSVRVSLPPWPYDRASHSANGTPEEIGFEAEWWSPISKRVGVAFATGSSVSEAHRRVSQRISEIKTNYVQYRTDVGERAKQVIPKLFVEERCGGRVASTHLNGEPNHADRSGVRSRRGVHAVQQQAGGAG